VIHERFVIWYGGVWMAMSIFLGGLCLLTLGLLMRRRTSGMLLRSQATGIVIGGGFAVLYGLLLLGAELLS
jgi:hypothetical protein